MRYEKTWIVTGILVGLTVAICLLDLGVLILPSAAQGQVSEPTARPVVSQDASPVELIAPIASDGHRGLGFLRKPTGDRLFPAIVFIHGGLVRREAEWLKEYVLTAPLLSGFLAAGYVVAAITYRSRDDDPQSRVSLTDCLAAVEHLRQLAYVDPKSIAIYGCSGGGDLALEIAAATEVAVIVPEEPASVLFTGIFNKHFPKRGERLTPRDAAPISADPRRYFTSEYQELTREKISRIQCPILIVQGDQHSINRFNAEVLIPELRSAGKNLNVITYPGEPHCFAFSPRGRSAAALKVFRDVDAFLRKHLDTQPGLD